MTDRYALFGQPLGHCKSPMIHAEFARQTGQDLTYEAIETPVGGFAAAVDRFRREGGRGCNVTLPFKLDAFAYANERTERARLAGAVNCMKFEGDRVMAENFDGLGLVNDLQRNLGCPIRGRRVLLLGAGGAAHGAVLPFLEQEPAVLVIENRTVAKARELGEQFSTYRNLDTGGYSDFAGGQFDIVVNATSASLRGELPPVPRAAVRERLARLRPGLRQGPDTLSASRARRRGGPCRRRRSACWSSRPPRRSSGGAACDPRLPR